MIFYLLWIILRSGMQILSSPQSFWMLTVSLAVRPAVSWRWRCCRPSTGLSALGSPAAARSGSCTLSCASSAVSLSRTLGCSGDN